MATYNAPVVEGAVLNMGYTGTVDTINILKDGLYKLEVYGGKGGYGYSDVRGLIGYGGNGGYSVGYKFLTKGTVLYACNGGAGGDGGPRPASSNHWEGSGVRLPGGYNGGGYAHRLNWYEGVNGSGGGATHIAKRSGTLRDLGSTNGLLIVAGGGGGGTSGTRKEDRNFPSNGGSGGGLTGGKGGLGYYGWSGDGGTQTSGRAFGYSEGCGDYAGPGGGGLYGGYSGGQSTGGGGGSGYIGGVPSIIYRGKTYSPSTQNGVNGGNGYSKITLVKKSVPLIYYGTGTIDAVMHGTGDITDIFYNTIQM